MWLMGQGIMRVNRVGGFHEYAGWIMYCDGDVKATQTFHCSRDDRLVVPSGGIKKHPPRQFDAVSVDNLLN